MDATRQELNNGSKYALLVDKLSLTATNVAELFEVNVTTSRRWYNQTRPVPRAIILVLQSMFTGNLISFVPTRTTKKQ